jgi:hypothetical protein
MSGYVPCGCRDCFDVAISSTDAPALCLLCKDAGCDISYGEDSGSDCQRDDAYGVEECPACGDPIDYRHGHGEIGDPVGAAVLAELEEM